MIGLANIKMVMTDKDLRVILRAWLLANGLSQAMVDRLVPYP